MQFLNFFLIKEKKLVIFRYIVFHLLKYVNIWIFSYSYYF